MSHRSIAERLNKSDLALNNAARPEIAPRLNLYGCDTAYLTEGRNRWNAAREALSRRDFLFGEQQELTRQLNEARDAAYNEYKALAQLARAVFRDRPGLLVQLGISGGTPRTIAGLLRVAGTLNDNAANPEIASLLEGHGYSAERIAGIQAAFDTLRQAYEAQQAAKGLTQQATQDLQAAMSALDQWMSQFRAIARVALRDNPQYLEQLGIIVRS